MPVPSRRRFLALVAAGALGHKVGVARAQEARWDARACRRSVERDDWRLVVEAYPEGELQVPYSVPGADLVVRNTIINLSSGIAFSFLVMARNGGEVKHVHLPRMHNVRGLFDLIRHRDLGGQTFPLELEFKDFERHEEVVFKGSSTPVGDDDLLSDKKNMISIRRSGTSVREVLTFLENKERLVRVTSRPDSRAMRDQGLERPDALPHVINREKFSNRGLREILARDFEPTLRDLYSTASDSACRVRRSGDDASSGDDGGCFLTTACCGLLGRPDDGFELRAMRRLRDEWMQRDEEGRREIEQYYRVAPSICTAISQARHGGLEWLRIYSGTILPCALAVRLGRFRLAHLAYRRLVRRLERRYLAQMGPGDRQAGI